MKKLKIMFGILFILLCLNVVDAEVIVKINVKEFFEPGEVAGFNYSIISDQDVQLNYSPKIICPAITPIIKKRELDLKANQVFETEYSFMTINEGFYTQTCNAMVEINEPFTSITKKSFEIRTSPSISIDFKICKDESCLTESKVFSLDEPIYFNYVSSISDLEIDSTLTYPDFKEGSITLPTSIKASQTGIYRLEITATKEGYRDYNAITEFSVIENEPGIIMQRCNSNLICEVGENYQNCPSDCKSGTEEIITEQKIGDYEIEVSKGNVYLYAGLGVLVLIALFVWHWMKKQNP